MVWCRLDQYRHLQVRQPQRVRQPAFFGEERGLADALRLANLQVPVLIQATPDHAGKMTIAFRRDSFCGKMSICNNLKQYGIPYSLTRMHTEAPDSVEFKADLEWFSGICRVVKG